MEKDLVKSVGRGGKNRGADVDTAVHLINMHRRRNGLAALKPRRKCDDQLISAIEEYQRSKGETPTGMLEAGGSAVAVLKTPLESYSEMDYTEPSWLKVACVERGKKVRERRGLDNNNDDILKYLRTASGLGKITYDSKENVNNLTMSDVDETAWCACFVKWCLKEAGKNHKPGAKAKAWRTYGTELAGPEVGAITVIHRTPFADSSSGWHVGFYVGGPPDAPYLLGGNQGNAVKFSQYYDLDEVYYRWPPA